MLKPSVFLNLCVSDIDRSIEFYTQLGFNFDPRFTNAFAACLQINENTHALFLTEEHFKLFTPKKVANPQESTEVLIALSLPSKEDVIQLCEKAFCSGARRFKEPEEPGPMFGWGFEDLDGHLWDVFWMNPQALKDCSTGF
jgi:predicted lactoylglutathione lyase